MSSKVFTWDTNPASNNAAPPDGFPEGMNKTDVNNSSREMMAAVRVLVDEFPWLEFARGETLSKQSATVLRIESIDLTAFYTVDREIKMVGATTTYARISNVVFSGGHTDITIVADTSGEEVPASPTAASVSVLDATAGVPLSSQLSPAATELQGTSDNLIRDSSFELDDLTRWATDDGTGGGPWATSATSRAGAFSVSYPASGQTASALIRANGSTYTDLAGHVPAQEDDIFKFDAYIRYSGSAPGTAKIKLGAEFRDEAGALIGSADMGTALEPTTGFLRYTYILGGAPAGTVYVVPIIEIETGSPAGTIYYFDDLSFYRRIEKEQLHDYSDATPDLASSGALTLPLLPDVVKLTGKTAITSIVASWPNRRVTLIYGDTGVMTGDPNLTFADADPDTILRAAGSWATDGFAAGQDIRVDSASNDGTYEIDTITTQTNPDDLITLVGGDTLVAEGPTNGHTVEAVLSITKGNNLKIASTFVMTPDDSITLVCDGTNWFEVARSVN